MFRNHVRTAFTLSASLALIAMAWQAMGGNSEAASAADAPVPVVVAAPAPPEPATVSEDTDLGGPQGFALKFRGEISAFELMSVFLLPGETLTFETTGDGPEDTYQVRASGGDAVPAGLHRWEWLAPSQKGMYEIEVRNDATAQVRRLNAFVMVPFADLKTEYLNGYRVGTYPASRLNNNPAYAPPRGFVEITAENADTYLSPHFKVKEFASKQSSGFPKYVVLQETMLLNLETLCDALNQNGYACERLHIMSGYRTPFYNKAIGNTTSFSRHNWGDAADIFVDNDGNGVMDDLNRDGRLDKLDAMVLQTVIETKNREPQNRRFAGGLSAYPSTASHGPFVHVDTRGFAARW